MNKLEFTHWPHSSVLGQQLTSTLPPGVQAIRSSYEEAYLFPPRPYHSHPSALGRWSRSLRCLLTPKAGYRKDKTATPIAWSTFHSEFAQTKHLFSKSNLFLLKSVMNWIILGVYLRGLETKGEGTSPALPLLLLTCYCQEHGCSLSFSDLCAYRGIQEHEILDVLFYFSCLPR